MCLQKKDFISAQALQRELVKRCPNDKVLAEFSKFLPAEVAHQKNNEEGEEIIDADSDGDRFGDAHENEGFSQSDDDGTLDEGGSEAAIEDDDYPVSPDEPDEPDEP